MNTYPSPESAKRAYDRVKERFDAVKQSTTRQAVALHNKRIEIATVLKTELQKLYNNTSAIPSGFLDAIIEFEDLLTIQQNRTPLDPEDPSAYEDLSLEVAALLGAGGVLAIAFAPIALPFLAFGAVVAWLVGEDKKEAYYREVSEKISDLRSETEKLRESQRTLRDNSDNLKTTFSQTSRLIFKLQPDIRRDYGDYNDQEREAFRNLMEKLAVLEKLYTED